MSKRIRIDWSHPIKLLLSSWPDPLRVLGVSTGRAPRPFFCHPFLDIGWRWRASAAVPPPGRCLGFDVPSPLTSSPLREPRNFPDIGTLSPSRAGSFRSPPTLSFRRTLRLRFSTEERRRPRLLLQRLQRFVRYVVEKCRNTSFRGRSQFSRRLFSLSFFCCLSFYPLSPPDRLWMKSYD